MAHDDQRMHGGPTPGMVGGRGHERTEQPVRLGEPEPGTGQAKDAPTSKAATDSLQPQDSSLGGHVATHSGSEPTPDDQRDGDQA